MSWGHRKTFQAEDQPYLPRHASPAQAGEQGILEPVHEPTFPSNLLASSHRRLAGLVRADVSGPRQSVAAEGHPAAHSTRDVFGPSGRAGRARLLVSDRPWQCRCSEVTPDDTDAAGTPAKQGLGDDGHSHQDLERWVVSSFIDLRAILAIAPVRWHGAQFAVDVGAVHAAWAWPEPEVLCVGATHRACDSGAGESDQERRRTAKRSLDRRRELNCGLIGNVLEVLRPRQAQFPPWLK